MVLLLLVILFLHVDEWEEFIIDLSSAYGREIFKNGGGVVVLKHVFEIWHEDINQIIMISLCLVVLNRDLPILTMVLRLHEEQIRLHHLIHKLIERHFIWVLLILVEAIFEMLQHLDKMRLTLSPCVHHKLTNSNGNLWGFIIQFGEVQLTIEVIIKC